MDEFCVALPKVELHAHLNGSLREGFSIFLFIPLYNFLCKLGKLISVTLKKILIFYIFIDMSLLI